jgi:cbb3-type cytochrome oxidase maturation protein
MSVIYILLPLALLLASVAVIAFIRAVKAGQFDDLDTPAHRILYDDDEDSPAKPTGGEPADAVGLDASPLSREPSGRVPERQDP